MTTPVTTPLAGIRVVDLTTVLMGPSATQALAEFGAEVIKVESPEGDLIRGIGPMRHPGMGAIFLNANRGKKSVVLDLKRPDCLEAMRRLIATADILAYNVRPQAMQRLKLGWEEVRAVNPRLLYVGLFGFARSGPYAARPAYDDIIQGASGLAALTLGYGEGSPRYAPLALADRVTGMWAVNNILAALLQRAKTGEGQAIDVTMFETMARMVLSDHLQGETFVPANGPTLYPRHVAPNRKPYATRDGHVCALIYSDRHWQEFLRASGQESIVRENPELATIDGRTRNINVLYATVESFVRDLTTAQAMALFEAIDVPAIPMLSVDEVLRDGHLLASGFFGEEEHPTEGRLRTMGTGALWHGTPLPAPAGAPRLGEHSESVLTGLGYSTQQALTLTARSPLSGHSTTAERPS